MTTETTNHDQPDQVPVSADDDVYFDYSEAGYRATDAAISAMTTASFASERPMFDALAVGLEPFFRGLTIADQHAVAGFLAGAANRVRESLTPHSIQEN